MGFNPIIEGGYASPQASDETYTVVGSNQNRSKGYHPVGTRGTDPETGRAWRYSLIGDATLGNAVIQGGLVIASTLSHADHDDIVLTTSGAAVVVGTRTLALAEADVDTTDIVANQYQYGYLHVQDGTANGFSSPIISHAAFDASGSATDGQIFLADKTNVAWGATSAIALTRNAYDRVGPATTGAEELVVGVANVAHAASGALATDVTAASSDVNFRYGWLQTWGPCAVLQGGTPAQGAPVASGTAANEVEIIDWNATGTAVDNVAMVGVTLTGGTADADYALVNLTIAP